MFKRVSLYIFLGIFFSFLLIFLVVNSNIALGEEQSFRTKKIVSVVYDDSGSMLDSDNGSGIGNWVYANYAMQAYIALLNPEDEIYITYMSAPSQTESLSGFKSDRQGTVNMVRDHFDMSGTPYSAVKNGFNTLVQNQSNESNVEYWLVIITDGAFENDNGELVDVNKLDKDINTFTTTTMNNGTTPKVTFFGIGDYSICPNATESCTVFRANSKNLMNTLLDIADMTSGRYQFDEEQVAQVEDNVLEIYSKIPSLSIGIMSQGENIDIKSVEGPDRIKIDTGENVSIRAPEQFGYETDTNLFGNAVIITNNGTNIPAGTIRITFTDAVDLSKLRVLYEPALKLKLSITRQGKEISDFSNLREWDVVDIKASICEIGTDNAIKPSALPAGVKYGIYYQFDGQESQQSSDMEISNFQIKQGDVTIGATASLDGVFNIKKEVSFTAKPAVNYSLKINKTNGLDHLPINKIKNSNEEIEIIILADGKELTYNAVKDLPFDLSVSRDIPYDLILNTQNGHYYFKPKYKWPMFTIQPGEVTVSVKSINDIQASTKFELTKAPWYILIGDLLLWPLLILCLLLLIFGYIRKKRFKRGSVIVYGLFSPSRDGMTLDSIVPSMDGLEEAKLKSFSFRNLLPIDEKKKIDGLTFLPSGNDGIVLVKTTEEDIKDWNKSGRRRYNKDINKFQITIPHESKLRIDEKDKTYSFVEGISLIIPAQGKQKSVYFYEQR